MTQPEIDRLLAPTLADRRLSGGERDALSTALRVPTLSEREVEFVRHRAFALARVDVNSPDAAAVLGWLEEVVKLLAKPERVPAAATHSAAWFSPGQDCPARIAGLIQRAKRTIDVCVFTITDDRIANPLLDAHNRGVMLRVLTDDDKSHEPGSDVYRLQGAGVPLRMDRSRFHMHHKFAIFDGELLLTGSYNWTRGAAEFNKENFLTTTDADLLAAYGSAFERLWAEFV